MSWLPWKLEYTKRGIEGALKKAAEAQEAAKKAAAPAKPRKKKKASASTPVDHASAAQVQETKRKLMDEPEKFTKVVLPPNGTAYFSQSDDRWANDPFPKWMKDKATGEWVAVYKFKEKDPKTGEEVWKTRTLRKGGCGPTSLAIAVATLRPDAGLTPADVGQFAIEKHLSGRVGKRGTSMAMVDPLTKKYGLVSQKIESDDAHKIDKLREGLDHHGVAVVHVKHGVFNYQKHPDEKKPDGGHFIAVIGYAVGPEPDKKEWFFVANPGKDGSAKTLADKELIVDRELGHHGAGMVRVSREELEKLMQESYMVTDPKAPAPAE